MHIAWGMTLPYTTWRIHVLVQEAARQIWLLYFERDGRLCRINRVLLILKVNPSESVNFALPPHQLCLPHSDKQYILPYVRPTNSESFYIRYTPTSFAII